MLSMATNIPMALVGAGLCALAFIPNRRVPVLCFLRAIGMLAIVAVPVGIAQFLWAIEGVERQDFPALVFGPLVAVPFNTGGLVCAAAFESIDRAGLMPPRQVTMHAGVYLPLLAAYAALMAGLIAGRICATGRVLNDRVILTVLTIALANSVLGITWPWWGS